MLKTFYFYKENSEYVGKVNAYTREEALEHLAVLLGVDVTTEARD